MDALSPKWKAMAPRRASRSSCAARNSKLLDTPGAEEAYSVARKAQVIVLPGVVGCASHLTAHYKCRSYRRRQCWPARPAAAERRMADKVDHPAGMAGRGARG